MKWNENKLYEEKKKSFDSNDQVNQVCVCVCLPLWFIIIIIIWIFWKSIFYLFRFVNCYYRFCAAGAICLSLVFFNMGERTETKINSKLNISFYVSHNYIILHFFLHFLFHFFIWQFWKCKNKTKHRQYFAALNIIKKTKLLRHLLDWKNNFLDFFFC